MYCALLRAALHTCSSTLFAVESGVQGANALGKLCVLGFLRWLQAVPLQDTQFHVSSCITHHLLAA
jgi:hypothetical protein